MQELAAANRRLARVRDLKARCEARLYAGRRGSHGSRRGSIDGFPGGSAAAAVAPADLKAVAQLLQAATTREQQLMVEFQVCCCHLPPPSPRKQVISPLPEASRHRRHRDQIVST